MKPRSLIRRVRRSGGFSLVEIMVGVAIGLIGALVMMQVSAIFEGRKRTTTSGTDAQTNGALALFTVERELRKAGYGISVPDAVGCTVNTYFAAASPKQSSFVLTPVRIIQGANGLPDRITTFASTKEGWSVPNRITTEHPQQGSSVFMNTVLGVAAGDMLIAYEPDKMCTLFQATSVVGGNVEVAHDTSSSWNAGGAESVFPASGYGVGALVFNLGAMSSRTYSVDASTSLVVAQNVGATNTNNVQTVASDIVSIKAEYGFDTRPGDHPDLQVQQWSGTLVSDYRRIAAVRMAVVARSPIMEKPNSDGICDITIATATATRPANSPTWAGGAIDVSKTPDNQPIPNWQCYRYKVFETVVPLRNSLWREP
ncbi:MAG: pilW2 [Noviherbaspirillum sp.]|nr:pilW2 [Noviherbaspirillum sp.]